MSNTATSPPAESAISPSPLVIGRTLGTVVVTLHGQVDGSISSLLAAVLRDLIEGQGNQSIVVDLSNLNRLHARPLGYERIRRPPPRRAREPSSASHCLPAMRSRT